MPGKKGRSSWGHIHTERSGRYSAREPLPDAPGQYRTIATFTKKKDAADALAVRRAEVLGGTWVDPAKGEARVADYSATFIATNGYKPRSLNLNLRLRHEWVAAELALTVPGHHPRVIDLGSRSLRSVTAQDIRDWHTAVKAESRRRAVARATNAATSPAKIARSIREWAEVEGLEVASTGRIPASVRQAWERAGGMRMVAGHIEPTAGEAEAAQAYRLVHAVFERAVHDGLIGANPCRIKGAGGYAAPERRPATVSEVRKIADAMPPRYRAAVWVAAFGSFRSGEQFALQRRDWVTETRTLWVERAVELESEAADFGTVKTTGSRRPVKLPVLAAEELDAHVAAYVGRARTSLIFSTSTGGLVFPDRIGKPFERARHKVGRDDLTWHDLRHTGQSLAAKGGASVAELRARSGHSTDRAALRYIHQYGDPSTATADRLDRLIADDERAAKPKKSKKGKKKGKGKAPTR